MATGCKPWKLSKTETLSSFENWKFVLINSLRHDNAYRTYLNNVKTWQRKRTSATRGFTNIASGKTAENQTDDLELMLGTIASYCPVIDRNIIIEDSKCITDVWKAIRLYFNF